MAKHATPWQSVLFHNASFARTGYHDENEWDIYKFILNKEHIYVDRHNYTGLDSSINISVKN